MPPQFVSGSQLLEAAWAIGILLVFILGAWLILLGMRRAQRKIEKKAKPTFISQLLPSLGRPVFPALASFCQELAFLAANRMASVPSAKASGPLDVRIPRLDLPVMLTVGSLEYQYGRVEEAMALFLKLTTLPADTEDLQEIIDKAGDFLINQSDYVNAGQLYAAAVRAHPQVALYHVGLGYCAAEGGRMEESVAHHRRADDFEPNSYLHLNDLGYSLLEAGQYDEAEKVLQRAIQLAPPDYDLAQGNLEHLRKMRSQYP